MTLQKRNCRTRRSRLNKEHEKIMEHETLIEKGEIAFQRTRRIR